MYRDKLEELSARHRDWDERPEQAPLDVLSWPTTAQLIWDLLERAVRDLRGIVATPQSLMTFEGPRSFFVADGEVMDVLDFVTLVRAYPLIYEQTPRRGISYSAVAAVVVAAFGIRATPMLLPVLDDRGVETMMLMHGRPPAELVKLRATARPHGQQPASIVRGETMWAPGARVEDVCRARS